MPTSVWDNEVREVLQLRGSATTKSVTVHGSQVVLPHPFPSPQEWRDKWIYFLMVDRFNNPAGPPQRMPHDVKTGVFQGGTFEGIRQQLDYLQELGIGAIWMTPVLKNCAYEDTFYGYGIQDFLQIDPRFASDPANAERELQQLIDEAHARGIYVIFDIVLNHTGDVFAYLLDNGTLSSTADFKSSRYEVNWRQADGKGNPAWTEAPGDNDPALHPDAAVWPKELRANRFFRQQGKGGEAGGDFESLKELVTAHEEVRTALIRIHQYLIAKFDIDGFRIDTLKYIEEDFARIFGNAIREFAFSIGKKNFFTFGEVYDDEKTIARFIGRQAMEKGEITGVDAALDFPLFYKLPKMVKNQEDNGHPVVPADVANLFEYRKEVQQGIISSHGEASRYFVTFLDNHDQKNRFYYQDPQDLHRYDAQLTTALACLFSLQGIPCLYYGTEQGLSGQGDSDRAVREALWGKPDAFDRGHLFYRTIRELSRIREAYPALRYGRQYFRPLSGDGNSFGLSFFSPGVLAFSRILHDQEVVIVANTHPQQAAALFVVVDLSLNPVGDAYHVLYSNQPLPTSPEVVSERASGISIREVDGSISPGPARVIKIHLEPMEVQLLAKAQPTPVLRAFVPALASAAQAEGAVNVSFEFTVKGNIQLLEVFAQGFPVSHRPEQGARKGKLTGTIDPGKKLEMTFRVHAPNFTDYSIEYTCTGNGQNKEDPAKKSPVKGQVKAANRDVTTLTVSF